ncbi:hypothetical protein ACFOWM_09885 [Ferruginibacter yonginensis]|uniref:Glycine dehydrogenase n=1 Tax=Ferruginibacter yonginensis TaxID=1310416 RepID=A0ABV8QSJ9_9BACT
MIKKLLNISCKQATYYTCKKDEGSTTFMEQLKLYLHLAICKTCRLFVAQTKLIQNNACHLHQHHDATLNPQKKEAIKSILETL